MNRKQLSDLPDFKGIPPEDKFIVPVFQNNGVTHKISINRVIEYITEEVQKGNEIKVIQTGDGIRFRKKP